MQPGTLGEKAINPRVYKDESPTILILVISLEDSSGMVEMLSLIHSCNVSLSQGKTSVEHLVHQKMPNLCRKVTFWLCN